MLQPSFENCYRGRGKDHIYNLVLIVYHAKNEKKQDGHLLQIYSIWKSLIPDLTSHVNSQQTFPTPNISHWFEEKKTLNQQSMIQYWDIEIWKVWSRPITLNDHTHRFVVSPYRHLARLGLVLKKRQTKLW